MISFRKDNQNVYNYKKKYKITHFYQFNVTKVIYGKLITVLSNKDGGVLIVSNSCKE